MDLSRVPLQTLAGVATLACLLQEHGATARAEAGTVVIAGTIVAGGVECPRLRTEDGRVFTLDGVAERKGPEESGVSIGTVMRVRGRVIPFSACQQGTVFSVIERLD